MAKLSSAQLMTTHSSLSRQQIESLRAAQRAVPPTHRLFWEEVARRVSPPPRRVTFISFFALCFPLTWCVVAGERGRRSKADQR